MHLALDELAQRTLGRLVLVEVFQVGDEEALLRGGLPLRRDAVQLRDVAEVAAQLALGDAVGRPVEDAHGPVVDHAVGERGVAG